MTADLIDYVPLIEARLAPDGGNHPEVGVGNG